MNRARAMDHMEPDIPHVPLKREDEWLVRIQACVRGRLGDKTIKTVGGNIFGNTVFGPGVHVGSDDQRGLQFFRSGAG